MAAAAVQGPLVQPFQRTAEDGLQFNNGSVAAPEAWHVDDWADEGAVQTVYKAENEEKNLLGDAAIWNNDSRAAKLRDYAVYIMRIDSEVERKRAQDGSLRVHTFDSSIPADLDPSNSCRGRTIPYGAENHRRSKAIFRWAGIPVERVL